MWAIDEGYDETALPFSITVDNPVYNSTLEATDTAENPGEGTNPRQINIVVPQLENQEIQWIELYNTTGADITAKLYFLFTPFRSHPTRDTVELDLEVAGEKTTYKVLDTVDTLFTGLWKLPGKRGDRPDTAFVSAYRKIDYDTVEMGLDRAAQVAGIPFGSDPNSWAATSGQRQEKHRFKNYLQGQNRRTPCYRHPWSKACDGYLHR